MLRGGWWPGGIWRTTIGVLTAEGTGGLRAVGVGASYGDRCHKDVGDYRRDDRRSSMPSCRT